MRISAIGCGRVGARWRSSGGHRLSRNVSKRLFTTKTQRTQSRSLCALCVFVVRSLCTDFALLFFGPPTPCEKFLKPITSPPVYGQPSLRRLRLDHPAQTRRSSGRGRRKRAHHAA